MKFLMHSLMLAAALQFAILLPVDARAETRAFLITALTPAIYDGGEEACPGGIIARPDTVAILAKLSASEREQLLRAENRFKLIQTVCKPEAGAQGQAEFKVVQGKVSFGFDLNRPHGKIRPAHFCEHENFVGPDGEPGIDNQWYRAVGCLKTFHPGGALHDYFNAAMRAGEFSILMTIEDIDDPRNDDAVRVGFYMAADPKAAAGHAEDVATTLRVHPDRYYQAVARGKVVAGVVTTEPVHMRLQAPRLLHELNIRDARVKLQLQPDGGLKGLLGGYQEITQLLYWTMNHALEMEVPSGPTLCPNFPPTIRTLADGYPDPKEAGPCGWISAAYRFEAVPARVSMR